MTSLAETLGFAPGDRVAVVHADDIGMSHAANEGAFEALERGAVTCGSIMVPCPWFREAAARARPEHDLGVHLTLNSEFEGYRWGPVAGASAVPSLLDADGFLPRSVFETVQKACPEEVEVELRAQIRRALDAGIDVTHVDSHMGTCFFPPFLPVYKKLALEFGVAIFAARPDAEALAAVGLTGVEAMLRGAVEEIEAAGLPVLDGLDENSLRFADGEGAAHNERRIANLGPGVSYLICHPAKDGEELRAITPDSAHQRDFERRFWAGDEGARALEAAGVATVGMRPLRELVRAAR